MSFYNNLVNRIYGTHQPVTSVDILNTTEYRDAARDDQVVRYISNHDVDQTEGAPVTTLGDKQGSLAGFRGGSLHEGRPDDL